MYLIHFHKLVFWFRFCLSRTRRTHGASGCFGVSSTYAQLKFERHQVLSTHQTPDPIIRVTYPQRCVPFAESDRALVALRGSGAGACARRMLGVRVSVRSAASANSVIAPFLSWNHHHLLAGLLSAPSSLVHSFGTLGCSKQRNRHPRSMLGSRYGGIVNLSSVSAVSRGKRRCPDQCEDARPR